MNNIQEINSSTDPVNLLREWLIRAEQSGIKDHNAIALATTGRNEIPNVRMVLLKEVSEDSFIFFTNYSSAKAFEILNGKGAAFALYWPKLNVQFRVRGTVATVSARISDKYFASRSLLSRYGAIVSPQSSVIVSLDDLLDKVEVVAENHGDCPPRPPHWGGYRITPLQIEFWQEGRGRLHTRFQWTRRDQDRKWELVRLAP